MSAGSKLAARRAELEAAVTWTEERTTNIVKQPAIRITARLLDSAASAVYQPKTEDPKRLIRVLVNTLVSHQIEREQGDQDAR